MVVVCLEFCHELAPRRAGLRRLLHPFKPGSDQIALRCIEWRKLIVGVGHTVQNRIQQLEAILERKLNHRLFERRVHCITVRP